MVVQDIYSLTRLYMGLQSCSWLYMVVQGPTWLYNIVYFCTSFCMVVQGFTWFSSLYMVVHACPRLYMAVQDLHGFQGCTWLRKVVNCFTRLYMVPQGCTLLYKVVKDCTKSCLSMLFVQILQVIITDSPQLKVAFKVHWGLTIQVSWTLLLTM